MFCHKLSDKDCIFIEYEDLIRCPSYALLKFIIQYKDFYKDYFPMEELCQLSDEKLLRLCIQRRDKNIFKYLMTDENFPYEETIDSIYDTNGGLFFDSKVLDVVISMIGYLDEKFSGDIYIYYPIDDVRVHSDVNNLFGNNPKVHFIYGDIFANKEIMENCNLFIVSSVEIINGMLDSGEGEGREYLLASYGYNLKIDGERVDTIFDYSKYAKDKQLLFKFATIQPMTMGQEYFD